MRSKSSDDDARKHVHPMEVENESGEVDPEPKEAQAARLGRTVRHDHVIRAASVAIVAVVLGIALVSADTFINAVGVLRTFVTQYCSWWIVLCAFLCFAVCIFVAVTKLGSIRLGGKDAKPAFSYFSWFAMLFATGQGVGLVFWAVAEPIMMYGGTPFNAPDPLFAGDTALAWTYFHWAIPAWAIYAIVSLFMAYARYNMHKDTTFRGTVEDLFPARAKRPVGIVVEILVVIATIFGLTTSLGLASYQFNSGIQQIFNIQTGQALQVAFVILFGSIATMSVWFGVVRGIKKISNANAVMSIVFVAAVFIFGPTLYILGVLPESLSVFIDQFMLMSGFTEAVNLGAGIASYGDSWQAFWSFFIFCWCFAFATFTAGFVSTISRGRTLREFVGGVVFVPAAVCIVWTCVVGGTGVWAAMSDPGIVAQTNADSSMGLFLTIDSVPLIGGVLTVLATILIGGYIVTSVDSGVMALSNFVSPAARQSRGFNNIQTGQALQVAFVILFGSIATMSVWFGVVRGIKKISNANAVMSIVFVAAVFIFGPTLYILGVLPESLSVFIDQFMLMSGFTEAVNLGAGIASYGDSWQAFWSFFIFCWCFAFATFTAGFVSTISRGRTLREFVGGVVFVPAAVCIVWTCVVGGTGVWAAMSDPGIVAQTNADSSMGLFLTIDSVPLIGGVLTVLATILIGGYIVTSVDSGVMALSNFVSPAARQSRGFKALLALCITALAVLFMVTAGQDFLSTIQFATIAGGIPFSVIVILMGVQFFKWVKHDEQLVERGLAEPFPEDSLAARQLRQWHEEREAREAEKAWLTRHEEVDVPDGAGLDESMKEVSR